MVSSLAVFDLDGTLTATNEVDSRCFVQAVEDVLGFAPESDWASYEHTTDEGILAEAVAAHAAAYTEDELGRVKRRFFELLAAACRNCPSLFAPLPGARDFVRYLSASGWQVCIATGAWRGSAEIKLRGAGFEHVPAMTTCDGLASRERIVEKAVGLAAAGAEHPFDRIVAVGDGIWDVKAAARLQLPFVGIGTGSKAELLAAAGATTLLADYSDISAAEAALATAREPEVSATAVSANPSLQRR